MIAKCVFGNFLATVAVAFASRKPAEITTFACARIAPVRFGR